MLLRDNLAGRRVALAAIATRHGASNVRLFGSVVRGEEQPDSDVDLLVDMAPDRGWTDYLALAEELERAIGRKVDLVLERSLSPHFRPFIEAEAQPL
jgi:predicted nucleotidyltransferase